jgi:hypothetical protein
VYDSVTQTVETRAITATEILREGKLIVSNGLRECEIVVTAGVRSLRQGEKVKLLPSVSTTNAGGML